VKADLLHAAVVVIDMQNDFAAPDGMFDGAGIESRLAGIQLVKQYESLDASPP